MSFADDLKNLDPNNPGLWPKPIQIVLFILLFIALLFAGWKFDITKKRDQLAALEKKETEKIEILKVRQRKAANLNALKEQMKEMEISFGDMVRQLPNQTEVAGLLVDISQTGLGAGLEFKLFEPKAENPKEFYAVLPISIKVVGNYHQFGEFISGLAQLPRIVTAHEIKIKSEQANEKARIPVLEMNTIAKTYRALEEDEEGSE
ncbi:MAG: pilus assembly protein PilO [Legionellales bacterium]|nr:pilus assembly protein PilO [Legionellales bacterium]